MGLASPVQAAQSAVLKAVELGSQGLPPPKHIAGSCKHGSLHVIGSNPGSAGSKHSGGKLLLPPPPPVLVGPVLEHDPKST